MLGINYALKVLVFLAFFNLAPKKVQKVVEECDILIFFFMEGKKMKKFLFVAVVSALLFVFIGSASALSVIYQNRFGNTAGVDPNSTAVVNPYLVANLQGGELIRTKDTPEEEDLMTKGYLLSGGADGDPVVLTLENVAQVNKVAFDLELFGTWDTADGNLKDYFEIDITDDTNIFYDFSESLPKEFAERMGIKIKKGDRDVDGTLIIEWYANVTGSDEVFGLDNIVVKGTPIPEPGTIVLFGLGIAGLVGFRRKFKK